LCNNGRDLRADAGGGRGLSPATAATAGLRCEPFSPLARPSSSRCARPLTSQRATARSLRSPAPSPQSLLAQLQKLPAPGDLRIIALVLGSMLAILVAGVFIKGLYEGKPAAATKGKKAPASAKKQATEPAAAEAAAAAAAPAPAKGAKKTYAEVAAAGAVKQRRSKSPAATRRG